jgi:hypothetical protein
VNSAILTFSLFAELAQLPIKRARQRCVKAQTALQTSSVSVGNFRSHVTAVWVGFQTDEIQGAAD